MENIDRRVVLLERGVVEHGQMLNGIRDAISSLEGRMDRRFAETDHRMDDQFAQVERRFDRTDARLDLLDAKVSRQFVYFVSLQVMTLIAMVGALGGVIAAILQR